MIVCGTDESGLESLNDGGGAELIALDAALVRPFLIDRIEALLPVGRRDARLEGSEAHLRVRLEGQAELISNNFAMSGGQLQHRAKQTEQDTSEP